MLVMQTCSAKLIMLRFASCNDFDVFVEIDLDGINWLNVIFIFFAILSTIHSISIVLISLDVFGQFRRIYAILFTCLTVALLLFTAIISLFTFYYDFLYVALALLVMLTLPLQFYINKLLILV